jgi:PAS domain S-box-containing protein
MSKSLEKEKFGLNMEDLLTVLVKADETIAEINQKGCELLEFSAVEVLGKNWFDSFLPDLNREDQRLSFHQLINGTLRKGYLESMVLSRSGKELIINWHLLPIKNPKGVIESVLFSGMEVTEHKRMQDRYIVLASFPAFNPNPIIELDFDGKITYTNPATKKVFPNLEKAGLNQPFFAGWEKIVPGFSGKLSTEYVYIREIKLEEHWYLQQFSFIPIGPKIRVYAVNIDEKKKIEEALRASEEKFRSLFENMLNGYAYCKMLYDKKGQPDDFLYLEINDAFETLTGLKRENVLGKKVSEIIPESRQSNPEVFEIYGRVVRSGKPERFETLVKPVGIWFDISVYSPKKDYFVTIFDNITKRKLLEGELQSYNQRLEDVVAQRTAEYAQANKRLTKEIMDHKKSEEGLLLRAMILDNLSQAIVLTNLRGEFVYTNHASCEMFGYSCGEFLEKNFFDILNLEAAERRALMDKLVETREVEFKAASTTKAGALLRVKLRFDLVRAVHGDVVVCVVDIT